MPCAFSTPLRFVPYIETLPRTSPVHFRNFTLLRPHLYLSPPLPLNAKAPPPTTMKPHQPSSPLPSLLSLSTLSALSSALLTSLRCLLALSLFILLAPITAPALFLRLPACLPVTLLDLLAVRILSLIAYLADVQVLLAPRRALPHPPPTLAWLPSPLVRCWTSPLPRAHYVTTYDQPGRWMTDSDLAVLRTTLRRVATGSIGSVPTHRLFEQDRAVFENRLVSVAYDQTGPVAFTAMVYLDVPGDVVVHLGLTMIAERGRGQRLQSALFAKSLLLPVVNLCTLSYHVTNLAASPAGIGNVSDYFLDCFPHYEGAVTRKEHHVFIARHVLARYRREFGCSERARFDVAAFVVYGSNKEEGGGTHQFIRKDGTAVSRHRTEICNRFVRERVDFGKGDELFQVARLDVFGTCAKYVMHAAKRKARK